MGTIGNNGLSREIVRIHIRNHFRELRPGIAAQFILRYTGCFRIIYRIRFYSLNLEQIASCQSLYFLGNDFCTQTECRQRVLKNQFYFKLVLLAVIMIAMSNLQFYFQLST